MDAATLAKVMGYRTTPARYAELCPGFNAAMLQANCTTINRAAAWIAQLQVESVGLDAMREYASGAEYDTRTDLGNTPAFDGDGEKYAGRGPIQVTGTSNYRKLSQWAHSKGYVPTADYFIVHPELLEQPRYGFLGAVWYWTVARPQINAMADAGQITQISYAVNGGDHGLSQRIERYNFARSLGAIILPTEQELFGMNEADAGKVLGASIQTGQPQVAVTTKDGKPLALEDRVLGPRTQRHTEFYNVDGNPKFASKLRKLAYLRAMVMDLWNELVFDGYEAAQDATGDPGLDEGKFGSVARFAIATHANSRRTLALQAAVAQKVGVDAGTIQTILGGSTTKEVTS